MVIFFGWVIWLIVLIWALFGICAFITSILHTDPFAQPKDCTVFLPDKIKSVISGLYITGLIIALVSTSCLDISKLHLLWIIPLWHFFGTQWITILYENIIYKNKSKNYLTGGNKFNNNKKTEVTIDSYTKVKKIFEQRDYSPEETFWILFYAGSVAKHDDNLALEEFLEIQLAIYCEHVNKSLSKGEAKDLFNLLKKRFEAVRNIIYKGNLFGEDHTPRELMFFLCNTTGMNAPKAAGALSFIIETAISLIQK